MSDRHLTSSPRQSRTSLMSSAACDVNSSSSSSSSSAAAAAAAAAAGTGTVSSRSTASLPQSHSSHALTSTGADHSAVDDDTSAATPLPMLFEDKELYNDSFRVLYEYYQSGTFCDVEIHVGSRHINCHRLVLACFSQYFR